MGAARSTCERFKWPDGTPATRSMAGRVGKQGLRGHCNLFSNTHRRVCDKGCAPCAAGPEPCRGGLLISAIVVGTHLGVETNGSTQKDPEMSGDQARPQKT